MAIEKKTILNKIEIETENSQVQVRLALLLVEDGVEISRKFHRTAFDFSIENSALVQMYAVNTHLVQMGEVPLEESEVAKIVAHSNLANSLK